MGKLVITDNHGNTTEHALDPERTTLGRAASNDIVLNDRAVSGHHAAIATIRGEVFLEDLDSTNGTQVNGQAVTRCRLDHGDVITLGRHSARYFGGEMAADAMDQTLILRTPVRGGAPPPAPPASAPASAPETRPATTVPPTRPLLSDNLTGRLTLAKLRVTTGANRGRELELTKPLTTIGKPGVQVAAITRRADGYYIVQVDSGGGRRLRINDADVSTEPRRLANGDAVELAGTRMEFLIIG